MWRFIKFATVTVIAGLLGVFAFAMPADAGAPPINITANVNLRTGPSTSADIITVMPEGSKPTYVCYKFGERVGGEGNLGTELWFKVTYGFATGYYTSYYDDVPLSKQSNITANYYIMECLTDNDITDVYDVVPSTDPETMSRESYDRTVAANWALQNAQAVRTNTFADCTWFVSQALWAGGLDQTSTWNGYGVRRGTILTQPGTNTARIAPELTAYLQERFDVAVVPLTDEVFRDNSVPEAQPGDVIAYNWNSGSTLGSTDEPVSIDEWILGVDHLAFVVSIANGNYPEVSEWGTVAIRESYAKRGWTWSALNNDWLQAVNDTKEVEAVLIHFNLPN